MQETWVHSESGRSPIGEKNNLFQYSCPENFMDRGEQWATVNEVTELGMTEHRQHPGLSREGPLMTSFLCGRSQPPGGCIYSFFSEAATTLY